MDKKKYTAVEIEIIKFENEDVITTSSQQQYDEYESEIVKP